jgi:CDP-diacylglycerol pyrophosphatase
MSRLAAMISFSTNAALICAALFLGTLASHSSGIREALWPVVQACRVNYDLTGAAFPCLEVNVSGGPDGGYVILRSPFDLHDFVLAPTKKIVGIEDSSLQAADAPNYFEEAWNARGILARGARGLPARVDVALAVNSKLNRTQDQLHIHIGCISTQLRNAIQTIAPALSETSWTRLGRPVGGLMFFARRIDQDTLAGVNPFRLASTILPDSEEMQRATIFIAGSRAIGGIDGFVLFATFNDYRRSGFQLSSSDLLKPSCASGRLG